MYAVEVRDHVMIAHSFQGEMFGPAQKMHGATFVVDARVYAGTLDENAVVIDIGRAHEELSSILAPLRYQNLDEVTEFKGQNTTTEFLARHVFDALAAAARAGKLGRPTGELSKLRVTLSESHLARAFFEGPI